MTGYTGAHLKVKAVRGKASDHVCGDCCGRAAQWSYAGGDPNELVGPYHGALLAYSLDPWQYGSRCVRCHRRFDAPPVTYCLRGHEYTEANTYVPASGWRQCRQCGRERARQQRAAREDVTA